MATIEFNALGSETQSYDQSTNPADGVLDVSVNAGLLATKTLNITNTTDVATPLTLNTTIGVSGLTTTTVNIGENVDLTLGGLTGVNIGSTFNYNLSDNSSFTMYPAAINLGALNTVNIDMGDTGTSSFTCDSGGVSLDLSGFPNLTNISDGDQITVVG